MCRRQVRGFESGQVQLQAHVAHCTLASFSPPNQPRCAAFVLHFPLRSLLISIMVKPFGIPELVDRIIDHLHDDIPTLRSTALVSKLWTPASHFHVLQRVYVIGEIGATTIFLGTPGTTIFPGGSIQSKLSHTASITFTQLAIDGSTVRNLLTTISHLKRLQSLNLHCCTWFCANEAEANLYLGPSLSLGSLQLSASCLHGHYHVATFLSSFRTIKHLKLLECNSNYTLRASDRPLLRASHRLSLDELSYRCANKLFLPELINILGMRPRNLRLDVSRKYDLSNHAICSLLHDSVQHLSVYIPDDTGASTPTLDS